MSEAIDETTVRRIARLARLNLSDDEVATFAGQLSRIVEYVRQIESLNTEGVEPMSHPLSIVGAAPGGQTRDETGDATDDETPSLANVLRDDEPHPSFDAQTALSNAPQRHGSFFRVPKVLDDAGGA